MVRLPRELVRKAWPISHPSHQPWLSPAFAAHRTPSTSPIRALSGLGRENPPLHHATPPQRCPTASQSRGRRGYKVPCPHTPPQVSLRAQAGSWPQLHGPARFQAAWPERRLPRKRRRPANRVGRKRSSSGESLDASSRRRKRRAAVTPPPCAMTAAEPWHHTAYPCFPRLAPPRVESLLMKGCTLPPLYPPRGISRDVAGCPTPSRGRPTWKSCHSLQASRGFPAWWRPCSS